MADLNVQHTHTAVDHRDEEEATNMEVVLYVIGILAIPLVPILMVVFLTPWSGM